MTDDDWFERALRELDDGDSKSDETRPDDAKPDETGERGDGDAGERSSNTDRSGAFVPSDPIPRPDSSGTPDSSETPETADTADTVDTAPEDPFAQDFTTAFENAPGPSGMGGSATGFGEGAGFGGGDTDEFGFGEFGGENSFSTSSFDDEAFESDIERIKIGIDGLDEMILGGVPKRSLLVAIGSAGTGKTTFGLQFLEEALSNDESAVYITLEESQEAILSTAEEKGWPFRQYVDEDRLAVVALDPVEMANSLAGIRNDLPRLIDEFDASRLVLDSVSLLEMMYDSPSKRRSEVFDFTRSLKDAGVTTMLTSEASEDNPYASRHGIVEYLTDAVFVLKYVRPSDFRETRLAVEIQKIRDANHSRETKPYEITDEGISVYRQANIF
ncbi:KaiC domain protein, AF_0351 family [Halogranum rubrum]|uniref:KaiC domain protein, AF_0351 family n=1 Tax=Halogranum rubrum TaxID=553466 RepID=A0A1I4CGN0_9EURY|nr:KaiC domain-containing protein [Halogranum rubrum]SFK79750.1 KaiC domain protein, AF_0351 family [Halogranum rubrum]